MRTRFVPSSWIAGCVLLLGVATAPARACADAAADAEASKKAQGLVDRMRSTDVAARKTAVAEAKGEQHPLVTAALLHALSDAEATVRGAALEGLVARTDPAARKQAAVAIGGRLARLTEQATSRAELLASLKALHDLAQVASLRALTDRLGLDVDPEELAARLKAIANVPAAEAVEAIIQFRSQGGRGGGAEFAYRRRMGREAFLYATGYDAGQDPDAMRKWWKDHEATFDYADAAARRAKDGGGPKAKPGDGVAKDPQPKTPAK